MIGFKWCSIIKNEKPPSLSLSLQSLGDFFSFPKNYAMALRVFRDGSLLLETPVEESLTASQDIGEAMWATMVTRGTPCIY